MAMGEHDIMKCLVLFILYSDDFLTLTKVKETDYVIYLDLRLTY